MKDALLKKNVVQILFFFSIAALIAIAVVGHTVNRHTVTSLKNETRSRLIATAILASEIVDIHELDRIQTPADLRTPFGAALKERLADFGQEWNILFIYYCRIKEDSKAYYIIDNDYNPKTKVDPSKLFTQYEASRHAFAGEPAVTADREVFDLTYIGLGSDNNYISAFAPVYDEMGAVAAIVGVDVTVRGIVQT